MQEIPISIIIFYRFKIIEATTLIELIDVEHERIEERVYYGIETNLFC